MGELGARLALEACLDPSVGSEFVPSWAGDSFVIYQRHGHAELLWESAWSGEAAQNVVNLLRLLAPCWQEQEGVAQEVHIGRRGSRVLVSRGAVDVDALLGSRTPDAGRK
jgi:hypothetical protein